LAALSSDEGKTWSTPVKLPTITMAGAKISGRRTGDGRYALIYNPFEDNDHRWPLAVVTGDDGILFDHILCVHGEVPPRRFAGHDKDFGPQYNRCIEEGNGQTPGKDLWVTYSMNKEDIWVSRIPVPVHESVADPVHDTFDDMPTGGFVTNWNIYSPGWAPVRVVEFPGATNKSLQLEDTDPYDYARAVRVFPLSSAVQVEFRIYAKQNDTGRIEVELLDRFGNRPVRLTFGANGALDAMNGAKYVRVSAYQANQWHKIRIRADAKSGKFSITVDEQTLLIDAALDEYVKGFERLSLRTGPYRNEPSRRSKTDRKSDLSDPDPDTPLRAASYYIDDVIITPINRTEIP
jgi:hypothetical protein